MQRKVGLALALLVCLTAVAKADPTITLGNYVLQPNMSGQTIPITVTGIDPNSVNGVVLSVMIDDGGPGFGGTVGPTITGFDVDTGTIWVPPNAVGHNPPAQFIDGGGQLAETDFLTTSGFTSASSGLVATLIIDTSGLGAGVHTIRLNGGAISDNTGDTTFTGTIASTNLVYNPGTITIVPEPSSVVLGMFAVAGLGAVAIRKRRARRA
jgi:hypothetical protein